MRRPPACAALALVLLLVAQAAFAGGADRPTVGQKTVLKLGPRGGAQGWRYKGFPGGEGQIVLRRDVSGKRLDLHVAFPKKDSTHHLWKMFQIVRTAWSERVRGVNVFLDSGYHDAFGRDAFLHDMLRAVGAKEVMFADGIDGRPPQEKPPEISSRPIPRRTGKSALRSSTSIWGTHPDDALVQSIGEHLATPALQLEAVTGAHGDVEVKLPEDPKGKDIFLMHTRSVTGEPVHQELLRTLRTAWTAKRAGAKKVTVVMPYLLYSRSDRKVLAGTDVGIATMARMFKAAGIDQIVTTSIHQPQEIGIFEAQDIHVVHMAGENILAERAAGHVKPHAGRLSVVALGEENVAEAREVAAKLATRLGVASIPVTIGAKEKKRTVAIGGLSVIAPDFGAKNRAGVFARELARHLGLGPREGLINVIVANKTRNAEGKLEKTTFDGDVKGQITFSVDDETASGSTMGNIAQALHEGGAAVQFGAVSHLMGDAATALAQNQYLEKLLVADTVPGTTSKVKPGGKVEVVPMGLAHAEVVKALDRNKSTKPWEYIERVAP